MLRLFVLLTAILTLTGCGTATASSTAGPGAATTAAVATPAPPCGPASSSASAHTLAAGTRSRVYVIGRTVYGCTQGSAVRRLGISGPCQGPGAIGAAAVAGSDAAVVRRACGVDTGSATIEVLRLTDGRTLSRHVAASTTAPESFITVQGLVLAADGTVAWIGEVNSIARHTTVIAVYAAGPARAAPVRTLDPGPGVAAGSLRLTGRTVSWRHGGTRRRAQL